MTQRKRGILTASQRSYLEDGADFEKYKKRSDLRQHIHSALLDGKVLFNNLPEKDRELIFDPREGPKVQYKRPTEQGGRDKGEVKNAVDVVMELDELERNIAALFALVYESLNKYTVRRDQHTDSGETYGRPFGEILGTAMNKVAQRNGWVLEDFEFRVEFDKQEDNLERRHDRFKEGEATMEEATVLLQQGVIDDDEFTEYAENYSG